MEKDSIVKDIEQTMLMLANEHYKKVFVRFFKTGKGEYGEGDHFLGIQNPKVRMVVKESWKETTIEQAAELVHSKWHEIRQCGLLIMVEHFQWAMKKKDDETMTKIFETYTSLYKYINNWDLTDLSCYKIIGEYEMLHDDTHLMDEWIKPTNTLWQQRMSMVATWKHIRYDRYDKVIERATYLLDSKEDLLHKAAGWMLREMYKHNETGKAMLEGFLEQHIHRMPSVMQSYAMEKMSADEKAYWRSKR